jgi:hypothetical protein
MSELDLLSACQKRWLWAAVAAIVVVASLAVWRSSQDSSPAGTKVPSDVAPPAPRLPSDELLRQLRVDNPDAAITSCRVRPDTPEWQPHEIEIQANGMRDLTALRQVRGLRRLTIVDPLWNDLTSLRGFGIAELDVARTGVIDLDPIRWLGLAKLELRVPDESWFFQSADVLVEMDWLKVNGGRSWDYYGNYVSNQIPPPREIVTLPLPRAIEVEELPQPRIVEP